MATPWATPPEGCSKIHHAGVHCVPVADYHPRKSIQGHLPDLDYDHLVGVGNGIVIRAALKKTIAHHLVLAGTVHLLRFVWRNEALGCFNR